MIEQLINSHKEQFAKVLEHYQHELAGVRTGRAHPSLLATVTVESYGAKMPLQQVASITASDAKTLTISPWDRSQIPAIEKGILAANLGVNPGNDGTVIRINLPPLNEERRKEMVKLIGQMAEQARIGIRQVREEIIKTIKKAGADGQINKDDIAFGQKKVQDQVDKYNDEIKTLAQDKEKEVMTV
jgi:ribosome recycling factor